MVTGRSMWPLAAAKAEGTSDEGGLTLTVHDYPLLRTCKTQEFVVN